MKLRVKLFNSLLIILLVTSSVSFSTLNTMKKVKILILTDDDPEDFELAKKIENVLNGDLELARVKIVHSTKDLKKFLGSRSDFFILFMHGTGKGLASIGLTWSELANLIKRSKGKYFVLESCHSINIINYGIRDKKVYVPDINIIDKKIAYMDSLYQVKKILTLTNPHLYGKTIENIEKTVTKFFVNNFNELFVKIFIPNDPLTVIFPEKSSFSGPMGYLLDLLLGLARETLSSMGKLNDDGSVNFGGETTIGISFEKSLDMGAGSFPLNLTLKFGFNIKNNGEFEVSSGVEVSKEQKGNIAKITNLLGTKIQGAGEFKAEGTIINEPLTRLFLNKISLEFSFQISKGLDLKELLDSISPGSLGEVINDVRKYFNLEISANIFFGGKLNIAYDFTKDVTELSLSIWIGSNLIVKIAIVEFEAGVKLKFDAKFSPFGNTFAAEFTAYAKAGVDLSFSKLEFEGALNIKWSANPEANEGTQMNRDSDGDGLPDDYEQTIGTNASNPDSDYDGIMDGIEISEYGTDPLVNDTDGDGMADGAERDWFESIGYDPRGDADWDGIPNILDNDSDNDQLLDGEEYALGSSPIAIDSDGDGLIDSLEVAIGTNPTSSDSDGDYLGDWEEYNMGLNPNNIDSDGDGLSDGDEFYFYHTNPFENDTDNDSLTDFDEINIYSTNPIIEDTDGDGIPDGEEVNISTSPISKDTDNDGIPDSLEINGWDIYVINDSSGVEHQIHVKSNPRVKDTDGDGVWDGYEYLNGSNPSAIDTDNDELNDSLELNGFYYDPNNSSTFVITDPANWDTDGDGLSDSYEKNHLTNPTDDDTDNDHLKDGFEKSIGTNATDVDSDDDGIWDGDEYDLLNHTYGVDPNTTDTDGDGKKDILDYDADGDGISDGDEVNKYFTNPLLSDTDNDGASDYSEIFNMKTNPLDSDTDGDGLLDGTIANPWAVGVLGEGNVGTQPLSNDTDGDGLIDGSEVIFSSTPPYFIKITDPLNPDSDFDGLLDGHEYQIGTDPNKLDSDGDGIADGFEFNGFNISYPNGPNVGPFYTDPLDNDTDNDGLPDGLEANVLYTSPISPDTDGDGLTDYVEVKNYSTDPLSPDTDNDGLTDYEEIFQWNWNTLREPAGELFAGPPVYRNETKLPEEVPPPSKKPMPLSYFTYVVSRFKTRITPFRGRYYTDPLDNDTDDDGLLDGQEKHLATNPLNNDTDSDGLLDGEEVNIHHTDPRISDCDRDDLLDGDEVNIYNTAPLNNDTDDDGLGDFEEVMFWHTNATNNDTDSDLLSDGDEVHGVPALIYNGSAGMPILTNVSTDPLDNDTDDDGLTDGAEIYTTHTNPFSADSDGDELRDGDEVFVYSINATFFDTDHDGLIDGIEVLVTNTDPLDPDENNDGVLDGKTFDYDNDTISDYDEIYIYGTSVTSPDTDGDSLPDAWEILYNSTEPCRFDSNADPDGDNLTNLMELLHQTNPDLNDTDGDGLSDGEEVLIYGTDPLNTDTDGDHMSDYEEIMMGNDPLTRDSTPPNIYMISEIPSTVNASSSLTIQVKVVDASPITLVLMEYKTDFGELNITMERLNTTHYVATIFNIPPVSTINLTIYAEDKAENWNKTETITIKVIQPPQPEEPEKPVKPLIDPISFLFGLAIGAISLAISIIIVNAKKKRKLAKFGKINQTNPAEPHGSKT